MTKEEWIEIKKTNEVPLVVFYSYWNDVKPSNFHDLPLGAFLHNMGQYMEWASDIAMMDTHGVYKKFNYSSCANKIIMYYDNKFGT